MGNSDKFRQHMNGFDKETKNRNKNTAKSVTDVASAFDTLNKAMKEYNQYGYLCADTAKSLVGLDDKFTACLTKQGNKLQINVEQFRKFVKEQLKEANAAKDGGKSADEMNKILNYLDQNVDTTTISFEQLTDAIKGYGTAMDEAKEKTDAIKSAFSGLSEVSKNKIENPFGALDADDVDKKYQAIRDLYDKTDLFTNEKYASALNPETGEVDYNSEAFKKMFLDSLDKMATDAKETGGVAGEYLAQGFEDAKNKIAGNVISIEEYIKGIGTTLSNINDDMDNFQSAFNDLSDIANEYNTYGDLSQDSIQKLMALNTKYVACLKLQGNQLVFNKDAFRDLYVQELKDLAEKYKGTDLGKRYAEILQKVANGTWDVTDHMKGMNTQAEKLNTTLSNLKSVLSSLLDLYNSAASNQTNDLQLWADAMNDEIDERIDKLDKQKEALDKENEAEERAIELTKAQDALARAQSQHTARVYGGNGYEWEASSADVRSAQQDLDDKRRQYRQADAEKAIEDEKKALNDLKDEYAKITKLIGKSLKDYNKQMKYTAKIQKMTLQDMKDSMTDYKDSVLENMKLVSAGTSMSDAISNIEKFISTLEKLNDIWTFFHTKGASTDGGGLTGLAKNMNTLGEDIYNKGFGTAMKDFLGKFKDDVWETLATSDNSIVQMFRNAWTLIEDGAAKFFTSEGLGKTIGTGLQNMGGSIGNWVGGLMGKASGDAALAQLPSLAGIASSLPVIGAIAAGVNNIFQQTKKTVDENEKLWADTSKSTSEKIVGSIGNVLYHLTPVEGWDKSIQYAKKAAEGDGIWEKVSNGFKSVYYGCGLGVILDNIWKTIKDIFHIQDKASKEADSKSTTTSMELDNKNLSVSTTTTKTTELTDPTEDSTKKKKWYESKVWFWNWGKKKATGDKGIKKSNLYNVDEQGSELIVRQPASGRYTYLETGDGVVPADITSKLFEMGGNPDKWFSDQMAKYNSAANGIQTKNVDNRKISIGDIVVSNPVGDADTLARELVQKLPSAIDQRMNKR